MSAHVLLTLLNELRKRDKMRGLPSIYLFFTTSLINSMIQEHECQILFITGHHNQITKNRILGVKISRFCHFTQRYNGRHYITS